MAILDECAGLITNRLTVKVLSTGNEKLCFRYTRTLQTYTARLGAILALRLFRGKPKYTSKPKGKVAYIL